MLQPVIDAAAPGSKIELPAGHFEGPVVIDKPLMLVGTGKETFIEGNGQGSVIRVTSADVILEGLRIRRGGRQRYRLDSGISAEKAHRLRISGCRLDTVLFGIVLSNTEDAVIENSTVTSYPDDIVDNRGDGIRLWGCRRTRITGNRLENGRDLALMRSSRTLIRGNRIENGRYGILVQMSKHTEITDNTVLSNYVGVMCSGAMHVRIEGNRIVKTRLATGIGIALAKGKAMTVERNTIMRHAQAFYIDSSPVETGMQRTIRNNTIAFNNEAFHFHAVIRNNTIDNNNVFGNLDDAVKDIRNTEARDNVIRENYWDGYRGFDRDGDGFGDTPYRLLVYADQLWQFDRRLKFFYATPLLSILDFIERLAPFSEPVLLFEDSRPRRSPIPEIGAKKTEIQF